MYIYIHRNRPRNDFAAEPPQSSQERKSGESPEILTSLNNLAVLLKAEGAWEYTKH